MTEACWGLPVRCTLVSSRSPSITRWEPLVTSLIRFETLFPPDVFVSMEDILLPCGTLASWE